MLSGGGKKTIEGRQLSSLQTWKAKPLAQALLLGSVPWNSRKEWHKRERTLQRCHRHISYINIAPLKHQITLSPFSLAMHLFPPQFAPSLACLFQLSHVSFLKFAYILPSLFDPRKLWFFDIFSYIKYKNM